MKLKDSAFTGFAVGLLAPAIVFTIALYAHRFYMNLSGGSLVTGEHKWLIFALMPNLIFLRVFFKNKQYPASGKSLLAITFLEVLAYFVYFGI